MTKFRHFSEISVAICNLKYILKDYLYPQKAAANDLLDCIGVVLLDMPANIAMN